MKDENDGCKQLWFNFDKVKNVNIHGTVCFCAVKKRVLLFFL